MSEQLSAEGISVKMVGEQAQYKGPVGLEDGGQVYMNCDTCGKPLLELMITRPGFVMSNGVPFEGDYKASCPYCDNYSKVHHVVGGFHITNIAEIQPNGHEKVVSSFVDQREVDGITILIVKKL